MKTVLFVMITYKVTYKVRILMQQVRLKQRLQVTFNLDTFLYFVKNQNFVQKLHFLVTLLTSVAIGLKCFLAFLVLVLMIMIYRDTYSNNLRYFALWAFIVRIDFVKCWRFFGLCGTTKDKIDVLFLKQLMKHPDIPFFWRCTSILRCFCVFSSLLDNFSDPL